MELRIVRNAGQRILEDERVVICPALAILLIDEIPSRVHLYFMRRHLRTVARISHGKMYRSNSDTIYMHLVRGRS